MMTKQNQLISKYVKNVKKDYMYHTVAYFLIFSSAPGVIDGALPAMGVGGISNTSTSSPPPVSGAP